MKILVLGAALACLAVPSAGGETCSSQFVTSLAQTNWNTTISVPRFDPAIGNLQSVRFTLYGYVEGRGRVENTNPGSDLIALLLSAQLGFTLPNQPAATSVRPTASYTTTLPGFDGIIDFAGQSGLDRTFTGTVTTTTVVLSSAADLLACLGMPHAPGTIAIPTTATGQSYATGSGALVVAFETRALAGVQVCYVHDEPRPFCAGDATSAGCPCGNASALGAQAGCVNSRGLAARLRGTGTTRLAQDLLAFTADGLPPSAPAVLFQGTLAIGGGLGFAFGDGLRCAGGIERRLGIQVAQAGVCAWPSPGSPSLSVAGMVAGPGLLRYQVRYRDASMYCTPETYNLTQGVEVNWLP